MTTDELNRSLPVLLRELAHGAEKTSYVLNRGDTGLLATLDRLSPEEASASRDGGASIAAHVDHLLYGLSLMNRWAAGENPFDDADWTRSWQVGRVSDSEWTQLRSRLREEIDGWHAALQVSRDATATELNGMIASLVHLAYHMGAIRQIHKNAWGPKAND